MTQIMDSPGLKREKNFMSTTRLFFALAALPLLAGVALAEPLKQSHDSDASGKQQLTLSHQQKIPPAKQPMQLNEKQMDGVTAGMGLVLPGMIWFPGRLPSDPINWPNGVPSCHVGPACL
jgi:hypothetical protein